MPNKVYIKIEGNYGTSFSRSIEPRALRKAREQNPTAKLIQKFGVDTSKTKYPKDGIKYQGVQRILFYVEFNIIN